MKAENLKLAIQLRHELHKHPDLSNEERPTLERIMKFWKEHTKHIEIVDKGHYIYGVYRSPKPLKPNIAFRADCDAILVEDDIDKPYRSVKPGVGHKCGHDGHVANMIGFSMEIDQEGADRDVFFLIQPAEENGTGAYSCLDFISDNDIQEIFAFHGYAGYPLNTVVIRDGLMNCASKGMIVTMTGTPTHASAPENGINPSFALSKLALATEEITRPDKYKGLVMATIVQIDVGEHEAFGVAASKGRLLMTIRGEYEAEMDSIQAQIEEAAAKYAAEAGLEVAFDYQDAFPETLSHPESNEKIRQAVAQLKTAFEEELTLHEMPHATRGSEDFGHFTKATKGASFFLGFGEDYPYLHTSSFDFRDESIEVATEIFKALVAQ